MSRSQRVTLNRRRTQRAAVTLPASVVTMDAYQYLDVLDLSATGGRLRGEKIPQTGKTALFRLNGYQSLCKVIWSEGEICGVQFEEMIPPRVLKHFRDLGTTASLEIVHPGI